MPRAPRETNPGRHPGIAPRTALTPSSSRSFSLLPSLLASLLLAVPFATAACTGGSVTGSGATTTAAATASPSATPTTAPSPTSAAATASTSTGAPALLRSPVLAVKVDNTSPARPRIGIGSADIVYVEPVEGGLTRLLAVFSSRMPAQVGPVRSARESDGALLGNYGRVAFAYSGGSAYTLARVATGPQIDVSYDTSAVGYRREPHRAAPYNVIGDPAALLARAGGAQPAGDLGWRLGPAPAGGAPASRLEAAYPAARVAPLRRRGRTPVDLYEYQARDMFEKHGVPVLGGEVATTPEQARAAAERVGAKSGGVVVVKAQVKTGGRGKAGGVKVAKSAEEAAGSSPRRSSAWTSRATRSRRS
jgi:hypothetical protein